MSYHVTCDCGRPVPVAATDAGSSVPCGCGRAVEVPPLHVLRRDAGQTGVSPVATLEALLLARRLPHTRRCAVCGDDTDGLAYASVQCLWALVAGGPSRADTVGSCLLLALFGWLVIFPVLFGGGGVPEQHGQDVVLTVPVRVCDRCRAGLADPTALRAALLETPEYAALLDRYPKALIRYLG